MVRPTRSSPFAEIKQLAPIDRWPRGIAYNGGFFVLGTPLGLGNASGAELRFLSSMDAPLPGRGRRIIGHRFIAAAVGVEKRGLDALGLDFGQRIKLGRMELAIFPSGLGPGAAQFLMTFRDTRILYCGGCAFRKPVCSQPIEIPECDLLLLDAVPADPKPPAPGGVIRKITRWAAEVLEGGAVPVAACGSTNAAFDVMQAFSELGREIRVQRGWFETFRRAEPFLSFAPLTKRLEQRLPEKGAVVYDARRWPMSRFREQPSARVAYVGPGRPIPTFAEVGFRLGESEDRSGIVSYVKQTGASRVALGAHADARLVSALQETGVEIYRVVSPKQIPLPFR